MLGRPPPTRQALFAAALGALWGILILPADNAIGVNAFGVAWFALSVALLFMVPIAYHAYVFWGILWIVYQAIQHARAPRLDLLDGFLSIALPVASLVLLMTSGYLARAATAAR